MYYRQGCSQTPRQKTKTNKKSLNFPELLCCHAFCSLLLCVLVLGPRFRELAAIGNQWRFFNDVQDSWLSVKGILDQLGAGQPECMPGAPRATITLQYYFYFRIVFSPAARVVQAAVRFRRSAAKKLHE